MTPRLITSSTFHLGFFNDPLNVCSFGGGERLGILSSYSVSESLRASLLPVLEAATVSPAIPEENLSWRISPTSSQARSRRSRSSFVCAAETQKRTLPLGKKIVRL